MFPIRMHGGTFFYRVHHFLVFPRRRFPLINNISEKLSRERDIGTIYNRNPPLGVDRARGRGFPYVALWVENPAMHHAELIIASERQTTG